MHIIQEKILKLSGGKNLATLTLRQIATDIGMSNESPQKIKHHLLQLQKKGFLTIDRFKGLMTKNSNNKGLSIGLLDEKALLFSIPIIGTANCGPATIFAEQNYQGFLKVSSKLIRKSRPTGLYAIKASGSSMNMSNIQGKNIESGDYVIVDSEDLTPENNQVVLAVIDGCATIKRLIRDDQNEQIVLKADSAYDYEPIYLHADDNFLINGKVIQVIKTIKN